MVQLANYSVDTFFLVRSAGSVNENLVLLLLVWQSDRFIPERGSNDLEVARYMITQKEKENGDTHNPLPIRKSIQEGDGSNFIEECKCFRQQLQNYFFQRKSVDIFPGFTTTCVGESPYS
jgi:hypothetical protein